MADQSARRSKKAKQKTKKRQNATITVDRPDTRTRDQMERVPSNAPTMAIAPSDYEHIFHENMAPSPPAAHHGQFATMAVDRTNDATSPPPPPLANSPPPAVGRPPAGQVPLPAQRARARDEYESYPVNQFGKRQYALEVQVTPDGYTMLGHAPDPSNRRIALPPHIVRADNQFSRAALARVSRYLASRAEPGSR